MTESKIKPTISQVIYCLKAECERYPEVCEECQLYGEVGCDHCYDDVTDVAIKCLKELEQYRAIGTIEEFKALKEQNEAKKPDDVRYFGEAGYYIGLCPSCGGGTNSEYQHCGDCGQKLDWS